MYNLLTTTFIAFAILLSQSVFAATPVRTYSPDDIASQILYNSGFYRSLEAGNPVSVYQFKTDANLPDPEIEGGYLVAPSGERNKWEAGISWGLEWPGVYSARKRLAENNIKASDAYQNVEINNKLIEIKRLLLDYIHQYHQISLIEQISAASDSVMTLAASDLERGEMTKLDIIKLNLEKITIDTRRSEIYNARLETLSALKGIYGMSVDSLLSSMKVEFPSNIPLKDIPSSQMSIKSPSVMAADADVEVARSVAKTTSRELLPGISFGYQHAFEEGIHYNGASLGLSIPLFSSRYKSNLAKAALHEAEIKAETVSNSTRAELESTMQRCVFLQQQVERISPLLENTDSKSLLFKAYKGGQITLVEYLNETNYFTEIEFNLLSLKYALGSSLLNLQTNLPSSL